MIVSSYVKVNPDDAMWFVSNGRNASKLMALVSTPLGPGCVTEMCLFLYSVLTDRRLSSFVMTSFRRNVFVGVS